MELLNTLHSFLRRCLFQVLFFGPRPRHIAFILDGNRRYGKKWNLREGEAYRMGIYNLLSILRYCYEMRLQYVTLYAFSIDNFNRKPVAVKLIMELIHERIRALIREASTANELGVRIEFQGDLDLLDEPIREAARTAMAVTARNTRLVILVCIAYTSTDEIVHGVQGSCREWARTHEKKGDGCVSLVDLERNMYFAGCQDPDILIRTSGETRLSNFLLWQTSTCILYAPRCLWPELSLRHLVWAVMLYQKKHAYIEKVKKKL